ncbi:ABC transporter permease [Jeotgalibaca ciconiae]|uniref:Sugar ABC transporter permease n=1 Tax=Jeotgalibaca ciconiae TaxID=2496265 RepID=A0A3Q9BLT8_9LACT|nr:ABC transporter permease subunit [Jeotgalibaca ciconiae]AZP05234.1 sugar ABC transporter permease [Jeotgalibaca ciconiae]HJB23473.1 ABC transporter permease subunit [Candidatus Jeotgalibaca pullicola]
MTKKNKKSASVGLGRSSSWVIAIKRDWELYILLIIPLVIVIAFNYASFPGLRMAFMNFKPILGYERSEWVGFENFIKIFNDADFIRALKNSIMFNFLDLITGFSVPIILALIINEIRLKRFKRISQTVLYLPHFLSWAVVGSVAYLLFKPSSGLVNIVLQNLGLIEKGIPFLNDASHWAVTYILIGIWQSMGWGTIIYLAAMTSINSELYEAAMIDGANRWKRIWHITLPGIRGTIVTLLIMNLGRVMGSNLERLTALGNSQVRDYQYQLAVYIFEKGLGGGKFSEATAVGLFQSLIGLALVLLSDRMAKKIGEDGLL